MTRGDKFMGNSLAVYNNGYIYKSNILIESSYNLTTAQNRLVYLAMTKLETIILQKDMNIETVEESIQSDKFELIFISVLDYKKTFNVKGNSLYTELSEIADGLYGQEVLYLKEDGDFGRKRWVITCEYANDEKGVSLQFHPTMIKDLLIIKSGYTAMLFEDFATKIKGKYSFRIYELCKQYLKLRKRDFHLDDLRFKLQLKDSEYISYSDLKKMLLSVINEINKNTDITLGLEEIEKNRTTRKVSKIRFTIHPSNNNNQVNMFSAIENDLNIDTQNQVEIISNIVGIKVTPQEARTILQYALSSIDKYELKELGATTYIKEKVKWCNTYGETIKIKNYIGLLLNAIKGNWNDKTILPKEIISSKKGFNNFEGRNYTDEQYKEIENKALGWNYD